MKRSRRNKEVRSMKKTGWIFGAVLCAALLFSGCGATDLPVASSGTAVSRVKIEEAVSSESASSAAVSSKASASSQTGEGRASGNEGIVNTVSTSNEAFNKMFKDNPIDAKYTTEMDNATSTVQIVSTADKYADIWSKEIDHAYAELKKVLASDASKWNEVQAGQKSWESGKAAKLAEIAQTEQSGGGSMAQITAANSAMEFYRSRAAQLYSILYGYEPNYTYSFAAN